LGGAVKSLGGFAKSLGDLLTRCGRFFHEMRISQSRDAGDFSKSLGGVNSCQLPVASYQGRMDRCRVSGAGGQGFWAEIPERAATSLDGGRAAPNGLAGIPERAAASLGSSPARLDNLKSACGHLFSEP
jgi:hypothetical protein